MNLIIIYIDKRDNKQTCKKIMNCHGWEVLVCLLQKVIKQVNGIKNIMLGLVMGEKKFSSLWVVNVFY